MNDAVEEYLKNIAIGTKAQADQLARIADLLEMIVDKETGNLLHRGHITHEAV